MSGAQRFTPQPKQVTINGTTYTLVAFYYPDKDTAWDTAYQSGFLGNFYPCDPKISVEINSISATFYTSEAVFQATKWWNIPADLQQFERAKTGNDAYIVKIGLKDPNDDPTSGYAGLGQIGAMTEVLKQKFKDLEFRKGLLATGDAYLLEHNEKKGRDTGGWSDDHDGHGPHAQNKLGKTLMEVRKFYKGAGASAGNYTVADFTAQV
jgi:predicted NAD-dependent protein-ADP-ribosyltransferase YbiA (DUF1768 family)